VEPQISDNDGNGMIGDCRSAIANGTARHSFFASSLREADLLRTRTCGAEH
jgi:hypothetical protein